jgi:hypothetical protein
MIPASMTLAAFPAETRTGVLRSDSFIQAPVGWDDCEQFGIYQSPSRIFSLKAQSLFALPHFFPQSNLMISPSAIKKECGEATLLFALTSRFHLS